MNWLMTCFNIYYISITFNTFLLTFVFPIYFNLFFLLLFYFYIFVIIVHHRLCTWLIDMSGTLRLVYLLIFLLFIQKNLCRGLLLPRVVRPPYIHFSSYVRSLRRKSPEKQTYTSIFRSRTKLSSAVLTQLKHDHFVNDWRTARRHFQPPPS